MRAYAALLLLAILAVSGREQVVAGEGGPTWLVRQDPQQNSQQDNTPPGSLSGRVVNSVTGEPVRGATVGMQNYSGVGNYQTTSADRAGNFMIRNLPPGDYALQGSHPSYLGILGLPPARQMVTVGPGQEVTGLTLRLTPGGTLSGKVLDDDGEPLSGCSVWVLGPDQGGSRAYAPRNGATTNDKGEYKFDDLPADRYLLYVRCQQSLPVERPLAPWRPEQIQPGESWLPVFYPDNVSPEGAQWLTVLPGSDSAGLDFRLKPTPVSTISGTISGVPPGVQPNIQLIIADSALDPSLGFGAAFDAATSTFQIQMVPPGSYRLIVMGAPPAQLDSLTYGSLPVTVGRTRAAPLRVQMHPGLTVSGIMERPPASDSGAGMNTVMLNSLQTPGRQPPRPAPVGYVNLMPLSRSLFSEPRQAEVHQDGTFLLQGLTPGRYRVAAQSFGPQPAVMESVQFGSVPAEQSVIDLAEGPTGSLRVRMGNNLPKVSANLAAAPANSRGGWMVYAINLDEPAGTFSQPIVAMGRGGDTVQVANLSAGRFAFAAIETSMTGGMPNERLNQLLRERLDPVEIIAGQEQTVTPKFFTSIEIEKLAMAYLRGETR